MFSATSSATASYLIKHQQARCLVAVEGDTPAAFWFTAESGWSEEALQATRELSPAWPKGTPVDDERIGLLRVEVLEATGLRRADTALSENDIFALLVCEGFALRTATRWGAAALLLANRRWHRRRRRQPLCKEEGRGLRPCGRRGPARPHRAQLARRTRSARPGAQRASAGVYGGPACTERRSDECAQCWLLRVAPSAQAQLDRPGTAGCCVLPSHEPLTVPHTAVHVPLRLI